MKHILLLIFIAISAVMAGQSVDKFSQDSILYLTDEQEAFMIDKETKFLMKSGPLGFEGKLSSSISVNTIFQPTYLGKQGLRVNAGLELRYYYKLPKLIREGKQANNLSSEYFSAGVEYEGAPFSDNSFVSSTYSYNLNWGSQKRFLNYGYIDYGIRLGYENFKYEVPSVESHSFSVIRLSNRALVGVAFGKEYEINDVVKCPIFKCHLDRKSAVKLNFNKIIDLTYGTSTLFNNKYRFTATLNPNFSYERKIGSSPFSINQELNLLLGLSSRISNSNPNAGIIEYKFGYDVSLRHYFKLKSNIRKGKSGNNLSGIYWFAGASFDYGNSKRPLYDVDSNFEVGKHNYINIPLGLGYQRTVLNDYYYDLQLGVRFRAYEKIRPNLTDDHFTGIYTRFKVGKLF